jgi:hypothetical protein
MVKLLIYFVKYLVNAKFSSADRCRFSALLPSCTTFGTLPHKRRASAPLTFTRWLLISATRRRPAHVPCSRRTRPASSGRVVQSGARVVRVPRRPPQRLRQVGRPSCKWAICRAFSPSSRLPTEAAPGRGWWCGTSDRCNPLSGPPVVCSNGSWPGTGNANDVRLP